MVTVLKIATIIGMITNDHSRDSGHPLDCLEDFDNFWEANLPRDGDHPKNGDHTRDGGRLKDFYHPKGWLLNFGSIESEVSTKNQIEQSVSDSVCLFACNHVGH